MLVEQLVKNYTQSWSGDNVTFGGASHPDVRSLVVELTEAFVVLYGDDLYPHGIAMVDHNQIIGNQVVSVVSRALKTEMVVWSKDDAAYERRRAEWLANRHTDVEVILPPANERDAMSLYYHEVLSEVYAEIKEEQQRLKGAAMYPYQLFFPIVAMNQTTFEPYIRLTTRYGVALNQ